MDIAAQEADVTEEQQRELDEARAEQGRCIDAIYGHSWWDDIADTYATKVALQKAAKALACGVPRRTGGWGSPITPVDAQGMYTS
ncbi:hypothetical protein AB0J63_42485 [Streptosporangium canum]|uniref:hypothetical protein n=1 Tax=Streptosporangium canum TaxID=324952 RepID=UPI00342F7B92